MKRSNLSLILYLSLVFISGLLVGGLGYRLYTTEATAKAVVTKDRRPTPDEWRARYVNTMTERLALSDDQVLQLNVILDEVKVEYEALEKEAHDAYRPKRRMIRDEQISKTMAILTPEQLVDYEKLRAERSERRRKAHEKAEKTGKSKSPNVPSPPSRK